MRVTGWVTTFSHATPTGKRFIEVKATAYGAQTPFYMTSAELDFAVRHQESYFLYRVYNVLDAPQFYMLSGNIAERTERVPVTYKVSPIPSD